MQNFIKKIKTKFGRFATRSINEILRSYSGVSVFYDKSTKQEESFVVLNSIKDKDLLMRDNEVHHLMALVRSVKKISGDIAEIGAYRGRSARVIAELERDKSIYAFDTFEGLPDLTDQDIKAKFSKGQFKVGYDEVRAYLQKYKNVYIYKGIFPQNSGVIEDKRFSLVNIDVDLYQGTLESLRFFYTRLNRGGAILIHDYLSKNNSSVFNAVNNFFSDKPETILEFGDGSQCLIVKL